jgi:ABC-type branched-subunit amino acid transport system substrate-binding protein
LANETNGVYGTRIESAKPNTFFTNELKRRTGMSAIDEDLCANRSYDSLMILKELIENTNSLNSDKIADNVKEINYNGISGNYTFDANNIVNTKFKTIMAKGGKLIEVE